VRVPDTSFGQRLVSAWTATRRREVLSSAAFRYVAVTAVLTVLAIVVTWPHVRYFDSSVAGEASDVLSGIRQFWALDDQGGNPFTTQRDLYLDAPDGYEVYRAANVANFFFVGTVWLLGQLFGWFAAFNTYNFVALVLSGTAAFALLDRLRFGLIPAAFGAYVFTFNPNHLEKAFGHAPLAATGILPLVLLVLLRKRARPSIGRSLTAGAVIASAFYFNSYLGLFALWMSVVFFAVEALMRPVGTSLYEFVRSWYFVTIAGLVGLIPTGIAWYYDRGAVSSFASSRTEALHGGFASPQLYLLPSPRHPLFGGPMHDWLETHLSWEFSMFFGYTTIALALAGVGVAIWKRSQGELGRESAALVVFAVALIATSVWASMPPKLHVGELTVLLLYMTLAVGAVTAGTSLLYRRWSTGLLPTAGMVLGSLTVSLLWILLPSAVRAGDFEVPTLSYFLREATTLYRVYSRFGVLVGLGLILLAAYALANVPRRPLYTALAAVPLLIVAFELSIGLPKLLRVQDIHTPTTIAELADLAAGSERIVTVGEPPAYLGWLARQPAGVAADYPNPAAPPDLWAWRDVFYQYFHRKPLWQTIFPSTDEVIGVKEYAADLGNPLVPSVLATAGVEYVVVHRDRFRPLRERLPEPACGLELRARFPADRVVVYRVNATNKGFAVRAGGFFAPRKEVWPEDRGLRWMRRKGKLFIHSPRDVETFVTGVAVSANIPRRLDVLDEAGRPVGAWQILPGETYFRFALQLKTGFNRFTLRATPGEARRAKFDDRRVTVAISALTTQPVRGGAPPTSATPTCRS
jgi:hypothetical protein